MVATPLAPAMFTGVRLSNTSFFTGYSMIVYVPSGFWTVLVTVVCCPSARAASASVRTTAPQTFFFISCTSLVSNQSRLIVEHGGSSLDFRNMHAVYD